MVALTSVIGLLVPKLLVRILLMPAASQTARTAAPAITPVPAPAGTRTTWPAPNWPSTRCGIVPSINGTSIMLAGRLLVGLFHAGRHLVGLAVAPADLARGRRRRRPWRRS